MVSTDTIQMLLKQRQDLRQALLGLRQEIETLDATSLDLVNKNVSVQKNTSSEELRTLELAGPESTGIAEEDQVGQTKLVTDPASVPTSSVASQKQPGANAPFVGEIEPTATKTEFKEERAEPILPSTSDEHLQKNYDAPDLQSGETMAQEKRAPQKSSIDLHLDPLRVLANAKSLSSYYLEHPSDIGPTKLVALDAAIAALETSDKTSESKAYHQLQLAYRSVASQTFADQKINGTTLIDSKGSVRILWILPLFIAALALLGFPALLFARTMATEMFVDGFALELVWVFGASAAFLWGMVGSLTLVTLTIALMVRQREYDADERYSAVLRGALGGIIGSCCFLILESWISASSAAAEFSLNMAAFVTGMISNIIFAGLHRTLTTIIYFIEPDNASSFSKNTKK